MKKHSPLFAFLCVACLFALPLSAQDLAPSPEGAYVCLAGKLRGQEGGPACLAHTRDFFSLWLPSKTTCSPFATMGARYRYLVAGTNVPQDDFTIALIHTFGACVDMPAFPPP